MSSVQVFPPFDVFTGTDGLPLESGYIYIGAANLNPEAAPVEVFYDVGLTMPAPQPIRTLGGYPSRAGTPARLYVASSTYSITVKDKNQVVIFTLLNSQTASQLQSELSGPNGSTMVFRGDRSLDEKWLESASIFDFMTAAQRADALSGSPALDHTVPVQNAFAAIGVTIRRLLVNDGATFRVNDTSTITSKSGFRIHGKGLIRQYTANKPIINLVTCTEFEIHSPRFYGLGTDFTPLVDTGRGDGIVATNCSAFKIHHCKFTNFGSAAIRTRNGFDFNLDNNTIIGTDGISAPITENDLYQFGIINQSDWNLGQGPSSFSANDNSIANVAIGHRVEPMARDYQINGTKMHDILGNHGMYLNGQEFQVTSTVMKRIAKVGVKLQSFHNALGPTVDPIKNAIVSGFDIDLCETGVSVDRTSSSAPKSEHVSIIGGMVRTAEAIGAGVIAQAVTGLLVEGNHIEDGFYGVLANQDGVTTDACSGKICGNLIRDTVGPAILTNTDEMMDVSENVMIRPCLGASAGPVGDTAIYATGTTASKRIRLAGNVLFTDTSIGVQQFARVLAVAANLGDNDMDGKPIDTTGSTIRQRSPHGDFVGSQAWGSSPNISSGASVSVNLTATGATLGDSVVYVSHASDLQGCSLSAYVSATNQITAVISNLTGGAKLIPDALVRWAVMRKGL